MSDKYEMQEMIRELPSSNLALTLMQESVMKRGKTELVMALCVSSSEQSMNEFCMSCMTLLVVPM